VHLLIRWPCVVEDVEVMREDGGGEIDGREAFAGACSVGDGGEVSEVRGRLVVMLEVSCVADVGSKYSIMRGETKGHALQACRCIDKV
jgi:hypothetical protein